MFDGAERVALQFLGLSPVAKQHCCGEEIYGVNVS